MAAFEDIQSRRSVVTDTLQLLTDQTKQWRGKIDLLEAGQHLDRAEALASLAQLLDVCQNLRYAILSEDCTATWTSKDELHDIVGRIDDTAAKRRRYLDLAQLLANGSVTHRRERTRLDRLKQRDAAVSELMETSALAAPPDLPGPAVDGWLEWACGLDDSTGDPDLQHLKAFFPRVDDFVRQLELELWVSAPAPAAEAEPASAPAQKIVDEPELTVEEPAPADEPTVSEPEISISANSETVEAIEAAAPPADKKPRWLLDTRTSGSISLTSLESIALNLPKAESAVAVEEPLVEVEVEEAPAPVLIAEETPVAPIVMETPAETKSEESAAPIESGKLCFFPADEVGKFSRIMAEAQGSRKVQALLAVSHWLTPLDSNPVLNATCGMRAQIGYTGSSDLLPVTPDQAQEAIDSDNGALLFTGGADLLRWGLTQKRVDDRFAGISSVRRLSQNQIKAWFKELHKVELAEPQVLDMYRLTAGVPLLVGELHRLVIPDPKTPPTWLGFMIWTTIKTNFERRLPVVARELRNGSAGVRLTEREIRVLKMVSIASDNSTPKTIAANLQEDWDQYHRPELEALGGGDEDSVTVLQSLGLLPMRRDYGVSAIQSLLPLGADDPLRQIVSYL
ncbi:MAG: hypothetical protein WBF42_10380 [Terracidiphilus sp.]